MVYIILMPLGVKNNILRNILTLTVIAVVVGLEIGMVVCEYLRKGEENEIDC